MIFWDVTPYSLVTKNTTCHRRRYLTSLLNTVRTTNPPYIWTNVMQGGPSWEASSCCSSQDPKFTNPRQLSLCWAKWIISTPSHIISLRFVLILSSGIRLGIQNSSFFILFLPLFCLNLCCLPCALHGRPILFCLISVFNICRGVWITKFFIMKFSPVSCSFLLHPRTRDEI